MLSSIVSIQFVFFTESHFAGNDHPAILSQFTTLFDGMNSIVPIPDDAPGEFPRMIIQSSDGHYQLSIAKTRIQLDFNVSDEPVPEATNASFSALKTTVSSIMTVLALIKEKVDVRQLGCVIQTSIDAPLTAIRFSNYVLRDGLDLFQPFQTHPDTLIRQAVKTALSIGSDSYAMNRIVTMDNFSFNKDTQRRNLRLELDINTLLDARSLSGNSNVEGFIDTVIQEYTNSLLALRSLLDQEDAGKTESTNNSSPSLSPTEEPSSDKS